MDDNFPFELWGWTTAGGCQVRKGANEENVVSKPTKLHKSRCCLKQQTADRTDTAVGRLIFLGQVDLEEEQKINIYLPLIAKSQS